VIEAVCSNSSCSRFLAYLLIPTGYLAESCRVAPSLRYSFFATVDGKPSRALSGRSRRPPRIVACENSFHGKTMGSLSVTGRVQYATLRAARRQVVFVPFGMKKPSRGHRRTDRSFHRRTHSGEGGIHVAPPGYLARAQELCRQRGALLIADEVQTGLGRTGKMFAVEHWHIEPDILTWPRPWEGGLCRSAPSWHSRSLEGLQGAALNPHQHFRRQPPGLRGRPGHPQDHTPRPARSAAAEVGEKLLAHLHELQAEHPL